MNGSIFRLAKSWSWRPRWTEARAVTRSRPLLFAAILLAGTLAMLWPLPLHAGSAVQDLGDPLYEIWTMRWVQHQLIHDPANLWNGNMGYPFSDSLLFSEPRISTSVLAWPIQIITNNAVLAYNLMLLASYFLVGLGMALTVWEITDEAGAATLTGFMSAFAPYRYGHLSHLNLLSYGWSLMALWALIRFARRRAPLDAALAALFLSIQLLASDTLGLMAGLLVVAAIGVLLWQERSRLNWRFATGLATILLVPALVELPVALARLRVDRLYGFSRDLDTVSQMSATLQSYVSVSPGNHFWRGLGLLPAAYPNPLFPGGIVCLAAVGGVMLGARRWPRWTIYAASIAVVGLVLSQGPYAVFEGHRYRLPYYVLYRVVPGFDAMRDAARFGMLALIGVEILAGLGLAALWKLLRPRLTRVRPQLVGAALVLVLLSLAAVELKTDVGTARVPNDPTTNAVYSWLAAQPDGPVIEFPANGLWANLGWTTQEIYESTHHWHPIVAAYTSFLPQRDVDMLVAIHGGTDAPSIVSGANVGLLQDLKIRYVVIHHWPAYDWQLALDEAAKLPQLTRVGDIGDATVFTLAPGNRRPVSHRLVAPADAIAGRDVIADLMTRNDNPTGAVSWLNPDPTIAVSWRSADGQVVSSSTLPVHLDVTVDSGLTHQPIPLTAPRTPGIYRLTIECPALHQRLEQMVNVTQSDGNVTTAHNAPLVLRSITMPSGPLRAGESVVMVAEWEVRQRLALNLNATLQALNEQNKPIAQWDGIPLGPALQTEKWTTGAVIVEPIMITIPPETTTQQIRLLLALYDYSSPSLTRQRILSPDGAVGLQYLGEPIPVEKAGQ